MVNCSYAGNIDQFSFFFSASCSNRTSEAFLVGSSIFSIFISAYYYSIGDGWDNWFTSTLSGLFSNSGKSSTIPTISSISSSSPSSISNSPSSS